MTNQTGGSAAIYVSDYATYNNGSLNGRWINLDGKSVEDINAKISEILKDNELLANGKWICEEPMVQDYEGFPAYFYSECMLYESNLINLVKYLKLDQDDREKFDIICDEFHTLI